MRSDMTFPHVDIVQKKTAYSVFEICTPSFLMALEVFKEKSKEMNLKTRKQD
jgi:hypothetical protein